MELMKARLTLDLPWIDATGADLEGISLARSVESALTYDDGIVLDVQVVDPAAHRSADAAIAEARRRQGPGRVVLIAGVVPLDWRASLRSAGVSFFDVSGVAEIDWPRIHLSARRFGQPVERRRDPLPLQKGFGAVTQELLIATGRGARPAIGELAEGAGVGLPTASKAISQLAEHGLVAKHRKGRRVVVEVVDRTSIARRLAEATSWPGSQTIHAYAWGRSVFDVAERLSRSADRTGVELAVTGRVGAGFLGILGTSTPDVVRCWLRLGHDDLPVTASALGLDPAPADAANVALSVDSWFVGTHRRHRHNLDDVEAWVAHPLRVWCDLPGEPRGADFAAQLWESTAHGA